MNVDSERIELRLFIYTLLITIAAAGIAGRILAVTRVYEPHLFREVGNPDDLRGEWPKSRPRPMPTLGANDRSRWATIRALVDEGTYVIGHRSGAAATTQNKYGDQGIIHEEGWETIDKVLKPDTNDFYSSKPPLLPTILAGEYWLLKHTLGWSIKDPNGQVVRVILFTVNWIPFIFFLITLADIAERLGVTEWGRVYVVAAGAFATFLSSFAITLNNHSIATCTALFALSFASRALFPVKLQSPDPTRDMPNRLREKLCFIAAGFFASFTACCELPAAGFAVALFLMLLLHAPTRTLLFYLPATAIPIAAFFATNYLALGQFSPAYSEVGGPWYEYPGSYWETQPGEVKYGIDWAGTRENKALYALHLLFGHHGLFSLSPVFLLSLVGIILALRSWTLLRKKGQAIFGSNIQTLSNPDSIPTGCSKELALVAGLTLFLTAVVTAFYVIKTGNYGGWTSGPRWLMWLSAFLLPSMLPCADLLAARRWGRTLGYLLLGFSVLSVSYSGWNPWRHPWLYDWFQSRGWINY